MPDTELMHIAEELKAMESRFVESDNLGLHLEAGDRARFKGLVMEAKSILDAELPLSDFSMTLLFILNSSPSPWSWPPSADEFKTAVASIESGANQIRRKRGRPPVGVGRVNKDPYVALRRISELQSLRQTNWDVKRLVRLLEELNVAHASELHMTTAILVRAITDHVPPIFGKSNFGEVANNYSGGASADRSFKGSMQKLYGSLKHIADSHLHVQIRTSEVLPTASQVDFHQDLDVLLGEVVRLLQSP